jgi:hypothetical protein
MYIIMPTGNIKAQKNWAIWILINEIPIEMRKITGEARLLKRKYFTTSGCISLSTRCLLRVAYHHIIHNIMPVVAITPAKVITTISWVPYVVRRPVKYAVSEIKSKNSKFNHTKVTLACLICSKILW